MHDGDFEVDILDRDGRIIGKKPRKDIVKGQDIYHAVYCVVITPDKEIVLNKIAQRDDLPNLHAGKLGCSCATIRRSGETSLDAAKRAAQNELHLTREPRLLAEKLTPIDGTYRMIGWYVLATDMPTDYNREDIEELIAISLNDFSELTEAEPDRLTPPLKMFWEIYSHLN